MEGKNENFLNSAKERRKALKKGGMCNMIIKERRKKCRQGFSCGNNDEGGM